MIGSGLYEVEVEGKTVGFQFGMLASMYTEEKSGQSIYDVFKDIAQARIKAILFYFLGGALAYNEYHKIKEEVTLVDIATLIETIGTEKALEIYSKSIGSPLTKNGQAPKEAGQSLEG
jgi:hypothetical protein